MSAATATSTSKRCGVCSKQIVAGYFKFGDYCGTTICMACMSKNTWSMCRKCNGTLCDYQDLSSTKIDERVLTDTPTSEINALFDTQLAKLKQELGRIQAIHDLAYSIYSESIKPLREIKATIEELEKQKTETYIAKTRKDARDKGPSTEYITLVPGDDAVESLSEQIKLTPLVKEVKLSYTDDRYGYKDKYYLRLFPKDNHLRVQCGRVVYKMDKEFAEIRLRSGAPCDIRVMRSHTHGPLCVAIKTIDNMVHIIYCGAIEYPYKSSRYIGYVESPPYPFKSLGLELSDSFRAVMKEWQFK